MASITVVSLGGNAPFDPVHLEPSERLDVLARRAARVLGAAQCKLVSLGGLRLSSTMTVTLSGLQDGDTVTAVALETPPVTIAAHRWGAAFAAVKSDGSVVTWGASPL